ncbi:MAG: hypothetical protein A0129_09320 [Limnobacter sp. CACIAM 66H1]|nr:MAG: hypothetical protein A0129_09320 [Limnobacter sp. CACIAM 66H1]
MVLMTVLVGVLIGILQAVFQLQDQSLPFGIKVFGTVALLVTLGPWMGDLLIQFTNGLLDQVAYLGKK